jgi:hypothetical protein
MSADEQVPDGVSSQEGASGDADPTARLSARGRAITGLSLVAWLALSVLATWWWWPAHQALVVFLVVLFGAGLYAAATRWLSSADGALVSSRFDAGSQWLIAACTKVMIWCFLIGIPLWGYTLAQAVTTIPNDFLRRAGLVLLFVLLIALLRETRPSRADGIVGRQSLFVRTWVLGGTVALLSVSVFAGVTWELYQADLVTLDPAPENAAQLVDFYMYYLVKAVPGSIPDTLKWPAPFSYDQHRVGLLLLLFMLSVAYPVVKYLTRELAARRQESATVDDGESPEPAA